MLIKTILSLMIISSSTYIGYLKANTLSERIKTLEKIILSIKVLETEINYSKNYLKNIFRKIIYKSKDELINTFFTTICEDMDKVGLFNSWEKAISKILFFDYLKDDDIKLLKELGKSLGNMDLENQNKMFKYFNEKFELLLQEAKTEQNNKSKIYRALGFGSGFIIVIMLA